MIKDSSVQYLYNEDNHWEFIVCDNSTISYPLHNHVSVYTFGMVTDGSIVLRAGQTARLYSKNQTFLIPPYVPHSIRAEQPYSLFSLCIPKESLPSFLNCMEQQPAFHESCFDNIKKQLESFPESKFSVEEMAQEALTSKYHFIRQFQKAVGLTPHQFQLQNRIRKAQRLIGRTHTITEAALTAGFYDQSHFIKQFEKLVGLTPSAYRHSFRRFHSTQGISFSKAPE